MIPPISTTTAPSYTITTSNNTGGYGPVVIGQISPDMREFGKAFDVHLSTIINDDQMVGLAYSTALKDYLASKKAYFPNWVGLPEIRVNPSTAQGTWQIGWYALVPTKDVLDHNQVQEDALWDS